jgi:hypothetical protein
MYKGANIYQAWVLLNDLIGATDGLADADGGPAVGKRSGTFEDPALAALAGVGT